MTEVVQRHGQVALHDAGCVGIGLAVSQEQQGQFSIHGKKFPSRQL
jgi:hypothetical protein